jgi:2-polyprenyl-3-methyl-5-hydroxy-6-metoxy-1,4-benzoquinol methylase
MLMRGIEKGSHHMRKTSSLTSRLMASGFAKVVKHRVMQGSYYLIFGWTCGDTPRYLHQKPIVFNFMGELSSQHILDVGCGAGMYTLEIARRGSIIVALDLRIDFIRLLKNSEPKLHVVLADAQSLPFRNGVFDKILCSEVLEHLQDDFKGIAEIARCSRQGGSTILSVPCAVPSRWFKDKVLSAQDFRSPLGHKRQGYNLSELVNMLQGKGLIVQKYRANMYFFTQVALYVSFLTHDRLPALLVTVIALFDKVAKFGAPYDIVIKAQKKLAK